MADIRSDTRAFIEASLDGDPALASLSVVGVDPETLTATIAPGRPPARLGRVTYTPQPPFQRETLVGLVVRMQRSRWSRLDAYTLSLRPATDDDLDRLGEYHPMRQDGRTMRCECGAGWYDMLEGVFSWCAATQQSDWQVSQLKEKYGGLRLYSHGASEVVEALIDAAEHLSEYICDVCGAPGKKSTNTGWVTTRCEEHAE